jgi:hypothetical protein
MLFTADFGAMTLQMLDEIQKNIKDPSLRDWFLPGFSTSTLDDKIACSATSMATMQKYFDYKFSLMCGIPKVTLTGDVEDWKLLQSKVERLLEFDLTSTDVSVNKDYDATNNNNIGLMSKWLKLLRPIMEKLVNSAQDNVDLHFWDTVCSHKGGGSGPSYLSGWITSFSVFDKDGKWQGDQRASDMKGMMMGEMVPFEDPDAPKKEKTAEENAKDEQQKIDDAAWPLIDTNDISHNVVNVPVTIDDNGKEYKSTLFAGQVGFEYRRLKKLSEDENEKMAFEIVGDNDRPLVRPRNDWCLAVEMDEKPVRALAVNAADPIFN